MKKLKPCPFCGKKAEYESKITVHPIIDNNGAYIGANDYYYEKCGCPRCDIWFENYEDDLPEEITIEAWNKRVGEADDNTGSN